MCLVRIDRIGNNTISKIALDNVNHMYDVSCFVECIENNGNCYKTSCNIIEKIKEKKIQKI